MGAKTNLAKFPCEYCTIEKKDIGTYCKIPLTQAADSQTITRADLAQDRDPILTRDKITSVPAEDHLTSEELKSARISAKFATGKTGLKCQCFL